jgi:hypothetical protein
MTDGTTREVDVIASLKYLSCARTAMSRPNEES